MQNSITFMGPFIVQNSQQTAARRGAAGAHTRCRRHSGATRRFSAISLKANVRANVRRGPNTMKICGRVWGYSSHCLLPAYVLLTVATTMYYVYYSLVGLDTATACLRATTMVENQKNSQWNTWEEAIAIEL